MHILNQIIETLNLLANFRKIKYITTFSLSKNNIPNFIILTKTLFYSYSSNFLLPFFISEKNIKLQNVHTLIFNRINKEVQVKISVNC